MYHDHKGHHDQHDDQDHHIECTALAPARFPPENLRGTGKARFLHTGTYCTVTEAGVPPKMCAVLRQSDFWRWEQTHAAKMLAPPRAQFRNPKMEITVNRVFAFSRDCGNVSPSRSASRGTAGCIYGRTSRSQKPLKKLSCLLIEKRNRKLFLRPNKQETLSVSQIKELRAPFRQERCHATERRLSCFLC